MAEIARRGPPPASIELLGTAPADDHPSPGDGDPRRSPAPGRLLALALAIAGLAAAVGADHPTVVVEPGRVSLDGPVVLVGAAGPDRPAEAWVLDGDGIRAREELDIGPRGGRGDVLVSGGRLAYLAPPDVVTLDLDLAGPVRSPGSAHRLLPASEGGTAWAIDEATTMATRVDLATGEAIEVVAIDAVVAGVRAAVADRFVVVAAGRTHLWSPDTGFSALPPSSDGPPLASWSSSDPTTP